MSQTRGVRFSSWSGDSRKLATLKTLLRSFKRMLNNRYISKEAAESIIYNTSATWVLIEYVQRRFSQVSSTDNTMLRSFERMYNNRYISKEAAVPRIDYL